MNIPYDLALEIFGLKDNPSASDVNNAYRRLAKSAHPDKGGDEKLFYFITECKKVLLSSKSSESNSSGQTKQQQKNVYITLSDLYDMYYRLGKLQQEYNITDICTKTILYIYPRFKKHLKHSIIISAECDFSNFSHYGYVPLSSTVFLPQKFSKYNHFIGCFELLDKTFKFNLVPNDMVTVKYKHIRFNTILELKIIKSNS